MEAEVRVVMTGHGRGEVFVNGEKLDGVRSVNLSAGINQENLVTLEIVATTVDISGNFYVATEKSDGS